MPTAAPITPMHPDHAARLIVDEAYAKECLTTPPAEALQEDFMRYAPDLAWWGERHADARREVALVELAIEEAKFAADSEVRESLAKSGSKITEAAVDAAVRGHPRLLATRTLKVDVQHHADRIDAILSALRAKRDMLVGLGASFRAEQKADPSIADL